MGYNRIIQKLDYMEFRKIISEKDIVVSNHAIFRLNEMQRHIYKDIDRLLLKEKPLLMGTQANHRITAFYKRKRGYLRIILAIHTKYIEIITFYITEVLPRLK